MRDWLPEQAVVFDWLETFCAHHVFGIEIEDEIFAVVTEMLRRTLATGDLSPDLRTGARNLKHVNERAKLQKAHLFQQATDGLRAGGLAANELDMRVRREITLGIERRLATLREKGSRHFYFVDNTFNLPPPYAKELCRRLIEVNLGLDWWAIVYPKWVD